MFPRDFYEILHIVGIALLFVVVGGAGVHAANGGIKTASTTRRFVAILHGTGALLILVGGFGMLARMGMVQGASFPGWLWAKIAIWLVLSAITLLPYRKPELARPFMILLPLLAGVAVYMALYKPF